MNTGAWALEYDHENKRVMGQKHESMSMRNKNTTI
jgi:hypothetical protein